ncbi:class I mannose-6-phosphate isomerase [Chloroflexi bacterium TSY]|nr:class I mannose-6-phosphate isomerase [Chloroflexi bacterium TSY]
MKTINYHQPFVLRPNRVWRTYRGGRILDRFEGKSQPEDSNFPEDWVGSATRAVNPGRAHLTNEGIGVAEGADGETFSMEELYTNSPFEALGVEHVESFGAEPYLLVKLLDSAMRLHIQAHPTKAWAQKHLNTQSGKTEAWWILQTRTDEAYVYMGFQHPPTPTEWHRIVDEQDLAAMQSCFDPIPVVPGELLLVEGGVPHAIGPGITMVEIQEPTDYVVRCEYAHGGLELPESARTMGFGLDRVLDIFDYTKYEYPVVKERFGPRISTVGQSDGGVEQALLAAPQTDRFEVRRIQCNGHFVLTLDQRFSILIVLDGTGEIVADGVKRPLLQWTRIYLPAILDSVSIDGNMTIARCLPPKP